MASQSVFVQPVPGPVPFSPRPPSPRVLGRGGGPGGFTVFLNVRFVAVVNALLKPEAVKVLPLAENVSPFAQTNPGLAATVCVQPAKLVGVKAPKSISTAFVGPVPAN